MKELTVVIVLMRMCDSDKLCAGKMWIHSHNAHEKLVQSFGVSIEEFPDLQKIPDLFMKAWDKYHHPILSLAYALNPEYHRMKPWLDPTVKRDCDTVFKKQFPDVSSRAKIKAAFTRFCNHEGPFAKLDDEGDKREVWTDEFMTAVAPWTWWQDVAQVAEPELHALAWRKLQVGVASSCNERVFSAWKNIMGDKRTRLGSKRQREEVSIYTNSRVLKKCKSDMYAEYDSAVASGSDDSDAD